MSMTFQIIECEECGLLATTTSLAGKFLWTDGKDTYWFQRQLGLCPHCCSVEPMEEFPDPSDLEPPPRRRLGWLWSVLSPLYRRNAAFQAKEVAGFAVAKAVLALNRAPVCLSCGSSAVKPLDLPQMDDADVQPRRIGARHPGCGGELTVRGSGDVREWPPSVTLTYDLQGRLIHKAPGW